RAKRNSQNSDETPTTSKHAQQNYFDIRLKDNQSDEQPPIMDISNIQPMEISNNDVKILEFKSVMYAGIRWIMSSTISTDNDAGEFQISYEKEAETNEKIIHRRIIDVSHFLSELKRISNHGPLGCSFTELDLISETLIGPQSKFTFKCRFCNLKFVINGDNCSENYLNINTCAVAGTIAVGAGHSQLDELMSAINLPLLSEKTYSENHELISRKWEDVLLESMSQAAKREKQFAISNSRVNKDGIPIIDVIADGCWSKDSHDAKDRFNKVDLILPSIFDIKMAKFAWFLVAICSLPLLGRCSDDENPLFDIASSLLQNMGNGGSNNMEGLAAIGNIMGTLMQGDNAKNLGAMFGQDSVQVNIECVTN
ncbi:unnamed protein product, partial [Leptidea sinapis]